MELHTLSGDLAKAKVVRLPPGTVPRSTVGTGDPLQNQHISRLQRCFEFVPLSIARKLMLIFRRTRKVVSSLRSMGAKAENTATKRTSRGCESGVVAVRHRGVSFRRNLDHLPAPELHSSQSVRSQGLKFLFKVELRGTARKLGHTRLCGQVCGQVCGPRHCHVIGPKMACARLKRQLNQSLTFERA
jgi:hypothetical protein